MIHVLDCLNGTMVTRQRRLVPFYLGFSAFDLSLFSSGAAPRERFIDVLNDESQSRHRDGPTDDYLEARSLPSGHNFCRQNSKLPTKRVSKEFIFMFVVAPTYYAYLGLSVHKTAHFVLN